jgi:hypothetical protein
MVSGWLSLGTHVRGAARAHRPRTRLLSLGSRDRRTARSSPHPAAAAPCHADCSREDHGPAPGRIPGEGAAGRPRAGPRDRRGGDERRRPVAWCCRAWRCPLLGGGVGSGPPAACGATVRAVLGDEFVPEKQAVARGQCPKCACLVEEGRGWREPPGYFGRHNYFCESFLRVRIDGAVKVKDCKLRTDHDGPHLPRRRRVGLGRRRLRAVAPGGRQPDHQGALSTARLSNGRRHVRRH